MVVVKPTVEEHAQQRLSPESLATALAAIETDGFVVLEDVVDLAHVELIRDRMLEDVQLLINRPDAPFNWNRGNVQQDPPPFPPYIFADVMSNEFAIQIAREILGNGLYNAFYSGNTAMPSDQRQPVHADTGQLWPNLKHPTPPYSLVVNLPMVDMGPENGSTEIWPGTHTDPSVVMTDGEIKVAPEVLEARRQVSPPIQPRVKAGSILIRDIRLWHAGMPNHTQNPRPMVAMIYTVGWLPSGKPKFHKDAEAILKHPVLEHRMEYVDEVDHISAPGGFEFADAK
jgi:ectoine hydroxylase-related dioxygenase (phytanoyl-CoA dioxygenase family)